MLSGTPSLMATFILVCSVATTSVASPADEFAKANQYYEEKDFDSAIQTYTTVLNQGMESASLYFNLGNAYFKKGNLGQAIVNFLRAKRLNPSDEDIIHNLAFAKQFSRVQMEGVQLNPIKTLFVSIVDSYRLDTLAWASSGCFVLLVLFLIVRFGVGVSNAATRLGIVLSLLALVMSVSLTTFKYRHDFLTRRGVITTEEAPVQTGPTDQSDIELQGAPGLVVEILAETSDYYNVLFENKRRGWIKKDLVTEI